MYFVRTHEVKEVYRSTFVDCKFFGASGTVPFFQVVN